MADQSENNTEFKEEQEFFKAINAIIDHQVDEKIMNFARTNQKFEKKKIHEQCSKKFFDDLTLDWIKMGEQLTPFFSQLKEDDQDIYFKLVDPQANQSIEALNESIKNCQHLDDFKKLSPASFLSAEDIKQLYRLGEKWFEENAFDKAFLYFLFLTGRDEKNPEHWLAKGMAEQNLKRYDDALISYAVVIQLDPSYADAYLQIMECLIHKNQLDTLKECYSVFIENIRPEDYEGNPVFVSKLKNIELWVKTSA